MLGGRNFLSADGMQLEDYLVKLKKNHMILFSYCPLKILKFDKEILQMQYLKKYKS